MGVRVPLMVRKSQQGREFAGKGPPANWRLLSPRAGRDRLDCVIPGRGNCFGRPFHYEPERGAVVDVQDHENGLYYMVVRTVGILKSLIDYSLELQIQMFGTKKAST